MKVFWSWQSDRDRKCCQYFVRDALKAAIEQIALETEFEERPEVDHDTKDVEGMPAIVDTILEKIRGATVFVADVTPVGESPNEKQLPNPNVMFELGYAERTHGSDRIFTVANAHWLSGPESLPFNLRHRKGPVTYDLAPEVKGDEKSKKFDALKLQLVSRLRPILIKQSAIDQSDGVMIRDASPNDGSIWSPGGGRFTHRDFHNDSGEQEFVVRSGPRLFVRVRPNRWTKPRRGALKHLLSDEGPVLMGLASDGDGGLNEDGAIQYWFNYRTEEGWPSADTVTQWFYSDGELWAVDTTAFRDNENEELSFGYFYAFGRLEKFLRVATSCLEKIGSTSPLTITLGVTGLLGTSWELGPARPGPNAITDAAEVRRASEAWTDQEIRDFLHDFFNEVGDAYGLPETESISDFERLANLQLIIGS